MGKVHKSPLVTKVSPFEILKIPYTKFYELSFAKCIHIAKLAIWKKLCCDANIRTRNEYRHFYVHIFQFLSTFITPIFCRTYAWMYISALCY